MIKFYKSKHSPFAYIWRSILFILGCLAVILGIIGVFLPGLPTVVFFLLAVYCFSRSSKRLENWILTHPLFGPGVIAWQQHGVISKKSKRLAITMICLSYACMLYFAQPKLWLALLVAGILLCVATFILTRPSAPRSSI